MARKFILAFTLMIVLVLTALPFTTVEAAQIANFKVDSASCKIGDTVTVKIDMLNAVDFAAGNFTIDYDSTKLKLISNNENNIVLGEVLLTNYMISINNIEKEGKIKIAYIANPQDESHVKQAGNILTLVFECVSAEGKNTSVDFSAPTLKERDGDDVNTKVEQGIITFLRPITSVSISRDSIDLLKDEMTELKFTYEPLNTTDNVNIIWRSSNTSVAIVNNGNVTAVGDGEAVITAELGKFTKTCVVKVTDLDKIVENYELDKSSETILIGEEETITPLYIPESLTDSLNIIWSTSNEEVAIVSDKGVVKAIGTGKATITLDINGEIRTCDITVRSDNGILGDVDDNGVVDANDASMILELYKNGNITNNEVLVGDLDSNDIIDANDASLILELFKTAK